jgi:anti-sigma B factor antagonist
MSGRTLVTVSHARHRDRFGGGFVLYGNQDRMETSEQSAMDLEIHQREKEGIWILDLRGRLVIGESETALRDAVMALAKTGAVNVILNFAEAKEIDEDGLGALVYCSAKLRRSGGKLKLLNLSRVHIDLIVLTGLDAAFDVFANEQDAVNSFFPDRAIHLFDILEFVKHHEAHPSSAPPK